MWNSTYGQKKINGLQKLVVTSIYRRNCGRKIQLPNCIEWKDFDVPLKRLNRVLMTDITCDKIRIYTKSLAEETKYTWVTTGLSTFCQRPIPKFTFIVVPWDGKVILTESSFTCIFRKLFTVGSHIVQVRL